METEFYTRERRLMDIARGKQYFRRIDNLAGQQWGFNTPMIPLTKTHFVTIRPLEKSQHIPSMFDNTDIPEKKKERVQSEELPNKRRLVKDSNKQKRQRVQSERFFPKTATNGIHHGKLERHLFNQWGSGVNPLDDKLMLKKEDLEPMFEPFRFRDDVKRVQKPTPKKAIPMSRVVQESKDRQFKTKTGFHSSRNGMVNVIHPIGPSPDITEKQQSFVGQASIYREKTVNLLKRIDRMIHPNKHVLSHELEASEKEIKSSKSPSLSNFSYNLRKNACGGWENGMFQESASIYKQSEQKSSADNRSITSIVEEMNKHPIDVDCKCRLWMESWTVDE